MGNGIFKYINDMLLSKLSKIENRLMSKSPADYIYLKMIGSHAVINIVHYLPSTYCFIF